MTPQTKASARSKVARAVALGRLKRPEICERCEGVRGRRRIEGHHPNYNKPLDVIWLCSPCHIDEHHPNPITYTETSTGIRSDYLKKLKLIAKREGVSKAQVLRDLIDDYQPKTGEGK